MLCFHSSPIQFIIYWTSLFVSSAEFSLEKIQVRNPMKAVNHLDLRSWKGTARIISLIFIAMPYNQLRVLK